jgi:hypothetical protein
MRSYTLAASWRVVRVGPSVQKKSYARVGADRRRSTRQAEAVKKEALAAFDEPARLRIYGRAGLPFPQPYFPWLDRPCCELGRRST